EEGRRLVGLLVCGEVLNRRVRVGGEHPAHRHHLFILSMNWSITPISRVCTGPTKTNCTPPRHPWDLTSPFAPPIRQDSLPWTGHVWYLSIFITDNHLFPAPSI